MSRPSIIAGIAILTAAILAADPSHSALLNQYCVVCHNEKLKTGSLMLDKLDFLHVGPDAEVWEKVVRKLRAGLMPPAGMPRPDRAAVAGLLSSLEASLDRAAAAKPNPGAPALHRLNRNEYANAVRDLIAVNIDAANLLPADDSSEGFDNVADVLGVSPALMERYITAAAKVSRVAVGDPSISAAATTYKVRGDLTQYDHIEGLPIGTRGGILIHHTFPMDGEYVIKVGMLKVSFGPEYGGAAKDQQLEITVNGQRAAFLDLPAVPFYYMRSADGTQGVGLGMNSAPPGVEVRLPMKAGPQAIGVAFIKKTAVAADDLFQQFQATAANLDVGVQYGFTTLPHVASVVIIGPYNAAGPGDTPSRRRIFVCRPASDGQELPCAKKIVSALARRAYRRPVADTDLEDLLSFYQAARNKGSFDTGIEMALRRILADPEFVFRFERDPANLPAGAIYRVGDLELASRLSFFLWSSIPDGELLDIASRGRLHDPSVLRQQTLRMLKNPRSEALVTNFAGQWLYLRELRNANPDPFTFPDFDDNLRQAFQRETELFFESVMREDRSVLDLLDADYTFVNERLAKHYGIPHIYGTDFRRVPVQDDARRGLLGQGSILLVTSVANRTSPVSRGKWILENILGSPPPLPPPNVPPLKESSEAGGNISVRQRMEQHRTNPVCASCHKIMDPIGFALENFDGVGQWRTTDLGFKVDASGRLVDGSKLEGPQSLRKALVGYPDAFIGTMTEKLMTYAIGRGLQYYDMPTVRAITHEAARSGQRFSALVLGIVNSAPFQMRVKQTEEGPPPRAAAAAR